ncbi:hypothetical protein EVC30_067 [Rhizobium phage RHph_Y1_11]|nr:hypothetical protein EVC30_067 [Rhizobium phage RHph_Y1_11]
MKQRISIVLAMMAVAGLASCTHYSDDNDRLVAERDAAKWQSYRDAGWCVPKIGTFPLDKPGCKPFPYKGGVYAINMGETPVEYALRSSGIRSKAPRVMMDAHQKFVRRLVEASPGYRPMPSYGSRMAGGFR